MKKLILSSLILFTISFDSYADSFDISVRGQDVICHYNFMIETEHSFTYISREIQGKALYKSTQNGFTTWAVDFTDTLRHLTIDSLYNPYILTDITESYCKLLDKPVSK